MRLRLLALAFLALTPARASAEWQIKPFLGLTFGGGTTLTDFEAAVGERNVAVGVTVTWLGEIVGLEADLGYAPGFFESESYRASNRPLVARSAVTTVTGNVVVSMPRRWAEYTLRPYVVGGFGLMRVSVDDYQENNVVGELLRANLPAIDLGGGVTGFLSRSIGIGWDLRYFRNIGGTAPPGPRGGVPRLSFWRANMSLTVRY
jgi:hypothetical protein